MRSPQLVLRSEVRWREAGADVGGEEGKDFSSDSSEERPHLVHRERS